MTAVKRQVKLIQYEDKDEIVYEVIVLPYLRFSTDNQSTTSNEDQFRVICRAIQLGHVKSLLFPNAKLKLGPEFRDEAVSGFGTVGRTGLDGALSMLRQGKAHIIAVACFKRFLRGMNSSLVLHDFLVENKCELLAVSDGFSSAEKGARLKFMNKAYASEEFLESVSIDTKRGLDERRFEGFSDGHLWFSVSTRPTRETMVKGKLKPSHFDYFIVEHLAKLVRRIFRMASEGYSQLQICRVLNDEHIPPPAHYDKDGNVKPNCKTSRLWRDKTVHNILNSKQYIGIIERGKTKNVKKGDGTRQIVDVPRSNWIVIEREDLRIIPQDLWDSVRERYREYNIRRNELVGEGKPFKHTGHTTHALTGMLKCGECGEGPIVIVGGKGGGFYGCAHAHRAHTCDNRKMINWKKLEVPFLSWIISQIQSDSICQAIATQYNQYRRARTQDEGLHLDKKERRLAEVAAAIANIVQAVEKGAASEALLGRLSDLEKESVSITETLKYLRGIDQSSIYVTPTAIKMRFAEIPNLLQHSEPFELNKALKPLFGAKGVRLERRPGGINNKGVYWIAGTLNLGKAMNMAPVQSMESAIVDLQIPIELKLD